MGQPKKNAIKKKWRESEVLLILDFLQEERDFEHPTAQFFYKKFLATTQFEATWELVRWKVRHLKSQFKKANDWLASTRAGVLEEDGSGSIEASILKICPHFNRLKEIFSKRTGALPPILCSDSSPLSPPPPSPLPSPATPASQTQCFGEELVSAELSDASPSTASMPTAATPTTKASRTAIATLAKIQQERIVFEKKKLELEERKFERKIEVEGRKLILEEKRFELEMKKQESESKRQEQEFELRRLEIEMKEKVAKYEIDRKYGKK